MFFPWLSGAETPTAALQILLLALALDALLGDPAWLYRILPHPVVLIGRLIGAGENLLNDPRAPDLSRALRGGLLTLCIMSLAAGAFYGLAQVFRTLPGGWILTALLASTLFAFRGLYDHAKAVAQGLERGLDEARAAVAHIVGRDPESLDGPGVARAAIESIAENFSDGVVAPVFWFLLFGLPGLAAYKAINTLDSMIGYKDPRHFAFGRVAARLDDMVNWKPARLAGGLIVLAAVFLPGASPAGAWRAMVRDAPEHRSPNAGWQEAAFAGALGFALAGPRRYRDQVVEDHWMGDGRRDLGSKDVHEALRLYLVAGAVLAVPIILASLL